MTREERREANRLKNERRKELKKKGNTLYAQNGRDERRRVGGAFGQLDPAGFNRLAEGTSAMRKAET
jgi:hypothetical protein